MGTSRALGFGERTNFGKLNRSNCSLPAIVIQSLRGPVSAVLQSSRSSTVFAKRLVDHISGDAQDTLPNGTIDRIANRSIQNSSNTIR